MTTALAYFYSGCADPFIDSHDRGFSFGDGLFTTIRIEQQQLIDWPLHWQRLVTGCQRLKIPPPQISEIQQPLQQLAQQQPDCVAKCILTRGVGGVGYQAPKNPQPSLIITSRPLPHYPPFLYQTGVRLRLCAVRLGHNPLLAGIKHLNRLENVLARLEWDDPDIFEGLLLDNHHVIEGVMSNVFFGRAGELHTPDLSLCGVAGVMRQKILHLMPQTQIGHYTLADFLAADEVFISNSLIKILPIKQLEQQHYTVGQLTRQLMQKL
jgi:4-amino-4-deoxychorismate lyase